MRTLTGGEGLVDSSPVSIQFPVLAEIFVWGKNFTISHEGWAMKLYTGIVLQNSFSQANIIRERTP